MFSTDRVRIRPATPDDAPGMYELDFDPETHLIADDSAFIPKSLAAVRAGLEKGLTEPNDGSHHVGFLAETVADGTMIGAGSVWGIDTFNQRAHIGLSLLPAARGQGYGPEVVKLLCRYGFRMRNLRRMELETYATNLPMRVTAERCGFTHEGTQREREYDGDGYVDVVIYGILRPEWIKTLG
jgi:RimJ/RimL family protein N-acetyltransferase